MATEQVLNSGVTGLVITNNSTLENIRSTFSTQQPHVDTFSFWLWDLIHSQYWIYISTVIELFLTIFFTIIGIYIGKKIKPLILLYTMRCTHKFDEVLEYVADTIVEFVLTRKDIDESE